MLCAIWWNCKIPGPENDDPHHQEAELLWKKLKKLQNGPLDDEAHFQIHTLSGRLTQLEWWHHISMRKTAQVKNRLGGETMSKYWTRWWESLDSIPGNFDFTIFLALNNYTWWQISQEQQPFPRKAVCGLKIDFTKTTNRIRQLHLVAHVDQVLSAIWMILKIFTWHSQCFWQSNNFSFNILQCDAIRWVQLSGQLHYSVFFQTNMF